MKKRNYFISYLVGGLAVLGIGPIGAQDAESNILQSTYISQPSLWLGPTLWDAGFAVEVEVNSLGSYRSYEATVKSIEKHQVGEYTSKLPDIKAAEWGYTVLNLATGQYDGSGRKINNIYLDNLASIANREQALSKIMEFVKQQYGYRVDENTWQTIEQGYPWYSMNGHHCWHHYAGAEGASVLSSEIGENIHGYQLHIAMNRGAAKQYNRPWAIDFSSWHGAGILDYSTHGIWEGYSGANHGHSISLVERSMLMSYMAGADAVIAEAGGAIAFYEEKTSDGTYNLTPYGEVFQRLTAFAKKHQVGITYTPVAILLNRYHGMDRQPSGQKVFGKFNYEDADQRTFMLIEKLWPETFSVERNGNERGAMVNGPFADQFDFLLQDASPDLLKTYKVMMLSGDVKLSDVELTNLKSYAEAGGIVLADSYNFLQFGFGAVGIGQINKKEWGKGSIVGYKMSALESVMAEYFTYDIPFTFSETVEHLVNVKDGVFYVTLINNDGITKTSHATPVTDNSQTKTITVTYTGKAPVNKIEEIWSGKSIRIHGNSVTITLKPGEAAVLEFSQGLPLSSAPVTDLESFHASVLGGCLQVSKCEGYPLLVSNLNGQLCYQADQVTGNVQIQLPSPGIYIVKSGDRVRKISAF